MDSLHTTLEAIKKLVNDGKIDPNIPDMFSSNEECVPYRIFLPPRELDDIYGTITTKDKITIFSNTAPSGVLHNWCTVLSHKTPWVMFDPDDQPTSYIQKCIFEVRHEANEIFVEHWKHFYANKNQPYPYHTRPPLGRWNVPKWNPDDHYMRRPHHTENTILMFEGIEEEREYNRLLMFAILVVSEHDTEIFFKNNFSMDDGIYKINTLNVWPWV